jgi:hypothetical protein
LNGCDLIHPGPRVCRAFLPHTWMPFGQSSR